MLFRLLTLVALLNSTAAWAGGLLKDVSTTVARPAPTPQAGTTRSGASCQDDGCCSDSCGDLFWKGIHSLYEVPRMLAGDDGKDQRVPLPGQGRSQASTFGLGADLSYYKGLEIATTTLDFAWQRWEFSLSGSRFDEWAADGSRDFFQTAKTGVAWRFVSTPAFRMHSGLGLRGFFDPNRGVQRLGFNFIYGGERSLGPVLIKADLEIGDYDAAPATEAKASAGLLLGPFEAYAGYQNLDIKGYGLGGPLLGLRGRF